MKKTANLAALALLAALAACHSRRNDEGTAATTQDTAVADTTAIGQPDADPDTPYDSVPEDGPHGDRADEMKTPQTEQGR